MAEDKHQRIRYCVVMFVLSRVFSNTLKLTFAYISDTARKRKDLVSVYSLTLATFRLSFAIGLMARGISRISRRVIWVWWRVSRW